MSDTIRHVRTAELKTDRRIRNLGMRLHASFLRAPTLCGAAGTFYDVDARTIAGWRQTVRHGHGGSYLAEACEACLHVLDASVARDPRAPLRGASATSPGPIGDAIVTDGSGAAYPACAACGRGDCSCVRCGAACTEECSMACRTEVEWNALFPQEPS